MAKKGKGDNKGMKLKFWYLILVVLAAGLTYVAQYFKFPYIWGIVLSLIFIVLIIKNFNKKKGVEVLVYFLILNILSIPLTLFVPSEMNLFYVLISLLINILVVVGLMTYRKWGLWLGVVFFILPTVSLLITLSFMLPLNLDPVSLRGVLLMLGRNLMLLTLMVTLIIYSIKARKYF